MHANTFCTSLHRPFLRSVSLGIGLTFCCHVSTGKILRLIVQQKKKRWKHLILFIKSLEQLSDNFQKYYTLGHFYDIDEISVYFKGRHICRCYNPNKPHKWHFKLFGLNCSYTGYLWKFYPYRGAAEKREGIYSGISATAFPVHKLTEPNVLHNKNHILCLDNWYMAPPLARFLVKERGIHSVGTCKTNRKGLPRQHMFTKTGKNKKVRGCLPTTSSC